LRYGILGTNWRYGFVREYIKLIKRLINILVYSIKRIIGWTEPLSVFLAYLSVHFGEVSPPNIVLLKMFLTELKVQDNHFKRYLGGFDES